MKLPPQKKILREDIRGAPPWADNLIGTINSFMENVYQALNRNITFTENVSSFIREVSYTTVSTYPASQPVIEILNMLRSRPIGLSVTQVYERSNYQPPSGPVYAPWIDYNGTIQISTITGLEADKTYIIRFLVF